MDRGSDPSHANTDADCQPSGPDHASLFLECGEEGLLSPVFERGLAQLPIPRMLDQGSLYGSIPYQP
jgi:hypothetical protein